MPSFSWNFGFESFAALQNARTNARFLMLSFSDTTLCFEMICIYIYIYVLYNIYIYVTTHQNKVRPETRKQYLGSKRDSIHTFVNTSPLLFSSTTRRIQTSIISSVKFESFSSMECRDFLSRQIIPGMIHLD